MNEKTSAAAGVILLGIFLLALGMAAVKEDSQKKEEKAS